MHRTDRLLGLLLHLQARGRATASEMARAFEVSRRTILRDMEGLAASGVPVEAEAGPGGGYRLMRGYFLPPLLFRPDEAWALLAGLQGLLAHGGVPRREALVAALDKVSAVLDPRTRQSAERAARLIGMHVWAADPGPWLDRLAEAVLEGSRLAVIYDGGPLRVVDPYLLYSRAGVWYLQGWCHTRQAVRVFRTDRIAELRATGERFSPPADAAVSALMEARRPPAGAEPNVVLRCSPEAVRALSGHPEWAGLVVEGDVVRKWVPAEQFAFVARFLLGFGGGVVVEAPAELRDLVVAAAREALAAYGEDR